MAKTKKAKPAQAADVAMADEPPVTRFKFRDGVRLTGVDPAAAAAELERIRAGGGLTPEAVVLTARNPDNPLHNAFEWDDSEAARQHRLYQARTLIRAVVIVHDAGPAQPVYVHVRTEEERSYLPVAVVANNPTLFQLALNELLNHLAAARKAVSDLRRMRPEHGGVGQVEKILAEAAEAAKAAKEAE